MPYVKEAIRAELNVRTDRDIVTQGELNFCLTRLCDQYIGEDVNYAAINEAIGALECAKLELYRRLAGPYEDRKIEENGDAYRRR